MLPEWEPTLISYYIFFGQSFRWGLLTKYIRSHFFSVTYSVCLNKNYKHQQLFKIRFKINYQLYYVSIRSEAWHEINAYNFEWRLYNITYCFNKAVRENHLLIAAHLQMKLILGLIACYHPSLVVNVDPHQENNGTKP